MTFQPLVLKPAPPLKLFREGLRAVGAKAVKVEIPELGLSYYVQPKAHIGKLLRRNGMYEEHIVNWITARFKPGSGGLFVDVGANFGWYSCLFGKIADRVILYEPEPDNIALLERNLAVNDLDNYTLFKAGAGSKPSRAALHKAHHSNPGAHTFVEGLYSEGDVDVPIVTLDDTLPDEKIMLLKMDIEGFELEALRGATKTLRRTKAMLLEYSPPFLERGGFNPSELWAMFDGFDVFRFEHGRAPVPLKRQPSDTCDLLALRS